MIYANVVLFFIEEISEVPDNAILISAHGVSQAIRQEARFRNLTMLFDATLSFSDQSTYGSRKASRKGKEAILIGHAGHPEVEGTMGQYSNPEGEMYLVESPDDVWKLKVKDEDNPFAL